MNYSNNCNLQIIVANPIIAYAFGYIFAIFIGHFCINKIVNKLWDPTGWREDRTVRPFSYTANLIGGLERALYIASFQINQPEFIAVWLALKVAGQWGRWEQDIGNEKKIPGRMFYNIFLIGNGLSLAYSVVGAKVANFLVIKEFFLAIVIMFALLIGSLILWYVINHYQKIDKDKGII
jgi:hypothetical protein